MPLELQVALIGLVGIVIGALVVMATSVTAGIASTVRIANDKFMNNRKVYEKYSDPLASSTTALMWRLRELLQEDCRESFFQSDAPRTPFEMYKAMSTLYRLGVLLAWIRALRRELFFLHADRQLPRKKQMAVDAAITKLEMALADGSVAEVQRVKSTAALLEISIPDELLGRMGIRLDSKLDRFVHGRGHQRIADLDDDDKRAAVRVAISVLNENNTEVTAVPAAGVSYNWRDFILALDIREARIYRDWQSAIGDLLLVETPADTRAYDVVGYRQFEQLCESGTGEEKKWLLRLDSLLDNIDISCSETQDARAGVLKAAYEACGEIILAVHELEGRRSPIRADVLDAARAAAKS